MKRENFIYLKKNIYLFSISVITIVFIKPAYAYGGPGLGIGALIVLITVIITFFASFFLKIFDMINQIIKSVKNYLSKRKTNKKGLNKNR